MAQEIYWIGSDKIIELAEYEKECVKYSKKYLESRNIADLVQYNINCIYLRDALMWTDAPIHIASTDEEEECDTLMKDPIIREAMEKYLKENDMYWP